MDTLVLEYGFLGVILLLTFFAFLIGIHKMFQVIVSTSFIMLIVLGWSGLLSYLSYYIALDPLITFFSFTNTEIVSFISSADTTTSLVIFVGLLVYAIHYAQPSLEVSGALFSSKLTQLLLAPLAIASMVVCLSVAIIGIDIFSVSFLQKVIASFGTQSIIYHYIFFLPLCIIIQGLLTLILLFPKDGEDLPSYDDV